MGVAAAAATPFDREYLAKFEGWLMEITRFAEAQAYTAPKHFDMRSLRLQGLEASGADFAWVGLSYFLPGGGAEMDAGPVGKIYVALEGEISIELADGRVEILRKLDSCFIASGTARAIRNDGNDVAAMLVVLPTPGAKA
jgi:quercetin dioxygenase-like cupin family protein